METAAQRLRVDWSLWCLPVVLAVGALLRFRNLSSRGLLYWDEGKFALEGIRMQAEVRALLHLGPLLPAGKAVGTAKPTHALLIALSYALLGVHDYTPLFLDASAGVLGIAVLYLCARRLFDATVAIVAALFLAVSEYDAIYSRSALSESDASLLFLIGVAIWSMGWRRGKNDVWETSEYVNRLRGCAGLLLGISFTANYRMIVYIAALIAVDLGVEFYRERSAKRFVCAGLSWGAGLAVAPLCWQVVGVLAQANGQVLFRSEITYRRTSYLSEALYQLHGGKQSVYHFEPLVYVQWFVLRQTFQMFALLLGGLVVALWRRTLPWLVGAALVLVPYVVYVFAPFNVPRNLDAAIPFSALLAAAALLAGCRALRSITVRRVVAVAAVLLFTASASLHAGPLTNERSGFAQVVAYLDRHHIDRAVVANEVMMFYLRDGVIRCEAVPLLHTRRSLERDLAAGFRYAVIDVYDTPIKQLFNRRATRLARFPAFGTTGLGENLVSSENGFPPGLHLDQHVDLYSIASLHLPALRQASTSPCSLDLLA